MADRELLSIACHVRLHASIGMNKIRTWSHPRLHYEVGFTSKCLIIADVDYNELNALDIKGNMKIPSSLEYTPSQ